MFALIIKDIGYNDEYYYADGVHSVRVFKTRKKAEAAAEKDVLELLKGYEVGDIVDAYPHIVADLLDKNISEVWDKVGGPLTRIFSLIKEVEVE